MKKSSINLQRADLFSIVLLASVYLAIILFSYCYAIFPVDDDWSYIRAAETFFKTGHLRFTPWTSPSLIFQVFWGALFYALFGFSTHSLILSTQVISFFGTVCFYILLRQLSWNPKKAMFLSLLIIFNPFSFPLLYTFFTDQHFIALLMIATLFYYNAALKNKLIYVWLGSIITLLAVLVRQPGIFIAAGAALYFLMQEQPWRKKTVYIVGSMLVPLAGFAAYNYWFQRIHGPTYSSLQQWKWIVEAIQSPSYFISKVLNRPLIILEFFGFSLIPFSLALLPSPSRLFQRRQSSLLLVFVLAGVLFFLINAHVGIYSCINNWMNGFHFAFVSTYGYRGTGSVMLLTYKIFDFLAMFSITHLLFLAIRDRKAVAKKFSLLPLPMLVIIGALQLLFLMVVHYKFTRYYLTLLPFFIFSLFGVFQRKPFQKKYFLPLLTVYILFSIAVTQDFLSWNQALWKLGTKTLKRGVATLKISAGFAWDCWHNMQYCTNHPYTILTHKYDIPWWIEELTPAIDPEYLISNATVPTGFYFLKYFYTDRYTVKDTASYYSLFYAKQKKIYLLKRGGDIEEKTDGKPFYEFLENLKGADIFSGSLNTHKNPTSKTIELDKKHLSSLMQYPGTKVVFRVALPDRPCAFKAYLATLPETWNMTGDGVQFKILLSDNLLENLFDAVGMLGVEQRLSFLKPRSYFFRYRTIYMHYIDPKNNPAQRKWHSIYLDLSRFSGKVVDIVFEVDCGPKKDDYYDVALWGEPMIEAY